MVPRSEWIEFHLTSEGEWLRGATDRQTAPTPPHMVAVARAWFERARPVEVRATTEAAARYLDKLLAAHPFDAEAIRRWAVHHREAPVMLLLARNRFEAALQAAAEGHDPASLKVLAEEEMDAAAWAELLL